MPSCTRRSADVVQKARQQQVVIVSPHILMLAINTIQTLMRDARMREQAHEIQKEVGALLQDVKLLAERVERSARPFRPHEEGHRRDREASMGRIVSRGRPHRGRRTCAARRRGRRCQSRPSATTFIRKPFAVFQDFLSRSPNAISAILRGLTQEHVNGEPARRSDAASVLQPHTSAGASARRTLSRPA